IVRFRCRGWHDVGNCNTSHDFPAQPDDVETMPSYLRARRESAVSGTETAVVAGRRSANRPWFGGLFGRFGVKPSGQTDANPGGNALFAFPLERALPDP